MIGLLGCLEDVTFAEHSFVPSLPLVQNGCFFRKTNFIRCFIIFSCAVWLRGYVKER